MGSYPQFELAIRGEACMDCARRVGKQLDLELKGAMQGHSWWHGLLCSVHLHPGKWQM